VVFNHVSVTDDGVSTGINVVKHVYNYCKYMVSLRLQNQACVRDSL
jgi:hypothetical protein